MRIYLIGYSYAGKSTMARQLAARLGLKSFDTDLAIEYKYHTSIPMFFQRYGEQAFRIVEQQMLQTTANMDNIVVATGGGTACSEANIQFILSHGIAIHMEMTVDDIMLRMAKAHKSRPSLIGKSREEQRQYITSQLTERLPYYRQAQLHLPALHANAEQLEALLKSYTAMLPNEESLPH